MNTFGPKLAKTVAIGADLSFAILNMSVVLRNDGGGNGNGLRTAYA